MRSPLTKAVINLVACQHNLSIAKQAAPNSKCIAIIKANAYGHGIVEIAKALTDADVFGVAHIDEALQLREAGITTPILLLEGFISSQELELVSKFKLDSVIHCEEQVQLLEQSSFEKIRVVVKVDSGMHRLGFSPNVIQNISQRLKKCNNINSPINYMTHFSSADDKNDDKTLKQLDIFYQSIENLEKGEVSTANSAGILGWPQSHAAWNRPGIMLYGVSPFINGSAKVHDLKPVMTLNSKLVAVKTVNKGESIGYGGTYTCDADKLVGIVAVGYGDGYPRHAKTGTPVLVNGQRCALLGRVSMDMICVDLSEQPKAKINDDVVLWGQDLPVEEIAQCADTIAYELLCGVTKRVEFKYID